MQHSHHAKAAGWALSLLACATAALLGCQGSQEDLSIQVQGAGRVIGTSGIDCASDGGSTVGTCATSTTEPVTVLLGAIADDGGTFAAWTYDRQVESCQKAGCPVTRDAITTTGDMASVLLDPYPEHAHSHVVARFAAAK